MGRIDYIDDPNAPQANSVVPSVTAVVQDEDARILLIHKVDNDLWALPGGGHDIGESIRETVVREVLEETGYRVEVVRLSGTYTNPRHVMAYDDGEIRQQFSLCFVCRLLAARRERAMKAKQSRWINREDLHALSMHPSMRLRIDQALAGEREAFIG